MHKLGLKEASLIAKLERDNIVETHRFAREKEIQCDSTPCRTVDVVYDQGQWDTGLRNIEYMKEVFGERGMEGYVVHDAKTTAEKFWCPGAIGSFEYDAGSISGYKFATGILGLAVHLGLNLQTETPVTKLSKSEEDTWVVETSRGKVTTPNVILATNGYTASLLPDKFQGTVVPLRGQVSAQRPGSKLPNGGSLPTTYSFIYDVGYEYMITRPKDALYAGDMVIGGGWARALPDEGMSEFAETNDSITQDSVASYLKNCTEEFFGPNWGKDHEEGRVRKEWTGIMGTSADGLPYVGEVPGLRGCWASVSFNGHGECLYGLRQALTDNTFRNGAVPEVRRSSGGHAAR